MSSNNNNSNNRTTNAVAAVASASATDAAQRQPRSAWECRAHSRNRALASNGTRGAISLIASDSLLLRILHIIITHAYPRASNILVACRRVRLSSASCYACIHPSYAWGDSAQVSYPCPLLLFAKQHGQRWQKDYVHYPHSIGHIKYSQLVQSFP